MRRKDAEELLEGVIWFTEFKLEPQSRQVTQVCKKKKKKKIQVSSFLSSNIRTAKKRRKVVGVEPTPGANAKVIVVEHPDDAVEVADSEITNLRLGERLPKVLLVVHLTPVEFATEAMRRGGKKKNQ